MFAWLMLALQAGLAVVAVAVLRRAVMPHVWRLHHPELVLDVWGPIALVLPLLIFAGGIETMASVRGEGWIVIAAPVMVGMVALGVAMMQPAARIDGPLPFRIVGTTVLAGLVLLLLGAAHDMSVWVGQAALALAAVLLWINTPEQGSGHVEPVPIEHIKAGWGMAAVLALAGGMGAAGLAAGEAVRPASAGIALGFAAAALAVTARKAGPAACARVGLWAAGLGVLLGLGAIAFLHMLWRALFAVAVGDIAGTQLVARGFGAYALEATILLVLGIGAWAAMELPRRVRVPIGVLVVLLAAGLIGWRITG